MIGLVSKIYDPIGLISPVVIGFKMLFQELCQSKLEWDDPLTDRLRERWKVLLEGLQSEPLRVPRWYLTTSSNRIKLVGFCDASLRAYAAIVYLMNNEHCVLVASKTRVAPLKAQTIPRLELLGALLLARLVASVKNSLSALVNESICYTDSLIVLHWIRGMDKQWKPFVQNRVREIREKVACSNWSHCRGESNPADLPSRGMTLKELNESQMWFHGPLWLRDSSTPVTTELEESLPSGCLEELRVKERDCLTLSVIERREGKIGSIMSIERFSSIEKLITCTAYVILFIDKLKQNSSSPDTATGSREENVIRLSLPESYNARAEILWIQRGNIKSDWRAQFMLYLDNEGVWRCGGRLGHSDLPYHTRYPILLPRTHYWL